MEAIEIAATIAADPGTAWSELDLFAGATEAAGCGGPSEGAGAQQCTLAFFDGDGSPTKFQGQPALPAIRALEAQAYLTGNPSVVAVIDTGIDPTHSMLAGRLQGPGWDFLLDQEGAIDLADGLDGDMDGFVDEAWGHGTHVASVIALVNPDARILPYRVLDSEGNGSAFSVAKAIHQALVEGADVVNLSLSMTAPSRAVREALELAWELEVPVFTSAGNTGAQGLFPARSKLAIAVAALDFDETKAPFSAYGHAIKVCAPGVEIYGAMPGEQYAWWSGTSMACAVASGAASLLHSVADEPEVAEELIEACFDVDEFNPDYEELLGEGRIDALEGVFEVLDD